MSNKEYQQEQEDAELEEFLQGRGELAAHLQALPQQTPPPELDDAIFAKVEAALREGKPAPQAAANDARIPEAANAPALPLRKQAWWRGAPLATAASVAIVGFLGLQWRHQLELDVPVPAQEISNVPAAPSAAAGTATPPRQPEQAPTDVSRESADTSPTQIAAPPVPARAQAELAKKSSDKSTATAAPPPSPEPAQSFAKPVIAGSVAAYTDAPKLKRAELAPNTVQDMTQNTAQDAAQNTAPRPASPANLIPAPPADSLPALAAAPAPLPPPAPSPVIAPAPVPMAIPYSSRTTVESRLRVPVAKQRADTSLTEKQAAEAKQHLNLVEELLKAGLRSDALKEWDKFRKAYPDYPVPDTVTEKIEALQH